MKPLSFALLACLMPVCGFAAPPGVPNAGTILQQERQARPLSPTPGETGLRIELSAGANLPASEAFTVKEIRITGNTLIDTASLHALVADAEDHAQTLTQLGALAARITERYRAQGYPLARAIIPAQVIQDGIVVFEVIEARYGMVSVKNRSQVDDELLQATLAPLHSGDAIGAAPMNRALLLLSDIPGVRSSAVLKPGATIGSTDLVVTAEATPMASGKLTLDNYGNAYTGRTRASGSASLNNLLHTGDVLSAEGRSSGKGMNDGRAGYDALLNGAGTRAGGAYSRMYYQLGDSLKNLGSEGSAEVTSLWAKHPLLRGEAANLYAQLQYDRLRLSDRVEVGGVNDSRRLDNWTASLSADLRDALLSGGLNIMNLSWTNGRVTLQDDARLNDDNNAQTAGGFAKWTIGLSRLQRLGAQSSLYLSYFGQWARSNLDPSMKVSAGGPFSVRAYAPAAASGDEGSLGSLELRQDLGWAMGQWQAIAFVDSARLTINHASWVDGKNKVSLSGAGLGLNWTGAQQISGRFYWATRLGKKPAMLGDIAATRMWMELSKGF